MACRCPLVSVGHCVSPLARCCPVASVHTTRCLPLGAAMPPLCTHRSAGHCMLPCCICVHSALLAAAYDCSHYAALSHLRAQRSVGHCVLPCHLCARIALPLVLHMFMQCCGLRQQSCSCGAHVAFAYPSFSSHEQKLIHARVHGTRTRHA